MSAKVTHSMASLAAEVMTERPSMATFSSTYSTPASAQAWASSSLMAREASLMSVSPAQKRAKPSPVPGPSTLMATLGFCSLKSSLTRVEMGSTVEEPEMTISPEMSPPADGSGSIDSAPLGSAPMLGSSLVAGGLAGGWLGTGVPPPPVQAPTTKALASAIEMNRLSMVTLWVLLLGRRLLAGDSGYAWVRHERRVGE